MSNRELQPDEIGPMDHDTLMAKAHAAVSRMLERTGASVHEPDNSRRIRVTLDGFSVSIGVSQQMEKTSRFRPDRYTPHAMLHFDSVTSNGASYRIAVNAANYRVRKSGDYNTKSFVAHFHAYHGTLKQHAEDRANREESYANGEAQRAAVAKVHPDWEYSMELMNYGHDGRYIKLPLYLSDTEAIAVINLLKELRGGNGK